MSLAVVQGRASGLRAQQVPGPLACSMNKKQPRWMERRHRGEASGRRTGCKRKGNGHRGGSVAISVRSWESRDYSTWEEASVWIERKRAMTLLRYLKGREE